MAACSRDGRPRSLEHRIRRCCVSSPSRRRRSWADGRLCARRPRARYRPHGWRRSCCASVYPDPCVLAPFFFFRFFVSSFFFRLIPAADDGKMDPPPFFFSQTSRAGPKSVFSRRDPTMSRWRGVQTRKKNATKRGRREKVKKRRVTAKDRKKTGGSIVLAARPPFFFFRTICFAVLCMRGRQPKTL